jgi:hypothetical protein
MNEHDRSLALHWPAREMQERDLCFMIGGRVDQT